MNLMPLTRVITVLTLIAYFGLFTFSAFAARTSTSQTDTHADPAEIPSKPSAPPSLTQKIPKNIFHCERQITYEGKKLDCDSNLDRDGERLRPILQDTPTAIAELDNYQQTRKSLRTTAYIGSFGLAVALIGFFVSTQMKDQNGNITPTGNAIRNISVAGGLATTTVSFLYGFSLMTANEEHLGNAVRNYNEAHPDHPIELQFTTGFGF